MRKSEEDKPKLYLFHCPGCHQRYRHPEVSIKTIRGHLKRHDPSKRWPKREIMKYMSPR